MKETRVIMGMPITLDVVDASGEVLEKIFKYFESVDERFSTYKTSSEISRINRGEVVPKDYSEDMREAFRLAELTKRETSGYFDIRTPTGIIDPSGLVKGWAIQKAAEILLKDGHENFWVEAGGDIQVSGVNSQGRQWRVGIRSPFEVEQIIKVVHVSNCGIATSGDYIRGEHIYDPHTGFAARSPLASVTVIGPNVYEADRYATAAYAMGEMGITFIEEKQGLEGYAVSRDGVATMSSGFSRFEKENATRA